VPTKAKHRTVKVTVTTAVGKIFSSPAAFTAPVAAGKGEVTPS
jgi:hypothetical protein